MSEIMEYFEIPKTTVDVRVAGARYAIDPVAFFLALICAPLLVAAMFFWMIGIPVFALFIGGLPYLIFGTPVLLIYLHYRQGSPEGAAGCAALTVVVGIILAFVATAIYDERYDIVGIAAFGGFALIHAFAWGIAFGKLYNRWRSDVSRQPLPPFPNQTLKGPIPC